MCEFSTRSDLVDLYAIAADKDASIASYLECHNEGSTGVWTIKFFRDLNYWELESVDSLFDILYANIPRREGTD